MCPSVSVVLPTYNQKRYLRQALDSVLSQTYRDFELIVVDDGSTDGTANLLEEYLRCGCEIKVIRQENMGLPRALNVGFAHAQGEYLTWTSSDNIMLPDMLAVLIKSLQQDRSVGLVYADFYLIDQDGNELGLFRTAEYDPCLLLHINLVHCCFLYRRECMERVGGYDPEFEYGEDWEYWIRISQYFRMRHVPQALYCYRFHYDSMTSRSKRGTAKHMSFAEFSARIRRRMPGRWWMGKFKWWMLRLFCPQHSLILQGAVWRKAIELTAYSDGGTRA
jgi:glycosyltransferase involved in cell wall biosynthesis